MKKAVLPVAMGCGLALLLAGTVSMAQEPFDGIEAMKVDIPFNFIMDRKEMPAGRSDIGPAGNHTDRVMVVDAFGSKGGGEYVAPVLERLADTGAPNPSIVFDHLGGQHTSPKSSSPLWTAFC